MGQEDNPGVGSGSPLQYSCLENSMDREARQATVYGVAESDMTEQLPLHFTPTSTGSRTKQKTTAKGLCLRSHFRETQKQLGKQKQRC